MNTMQDKITRRIEAIAEKHGLEAVKAFDYSNVGTFHFQRHDSTETLFAVHVSFQSNNLGGGIRQRREPAQEFPYCEYHGSNGGEVSKFLDAIDARAAKFARQTRLPRQEHSLDDLRNELVEAVSAMEGSKGQLGYNGAMIEALGFLTYNNFSEIDRALKSAGRPQSPDAIAMLRTMADEYEQAIETHIYDGDEPKDSPPRKLVAEARAVADAAERGTIMQIIANAIALNDVDVAVRLIQDALGITDGGVCGMHLNEHTWQTADRHSRILLIAGWLADEINGLS